MRASGRSILLMTTIGGSLRFERLHQHVAGLRQRAFAGVHQQHDAVDDLERALDFAAEIAVAGGVDDVDLDAVVADAGGLGENGDAALALQVVGIHDALGDALRWRGKMPLWRSMASTSVVLPWSTCAMMAMLRIFGLLLVMNHFLIGIGAQTRSLPRSAIWGVSCSLTCTTCETATLLFVNHIDRIQARGDARRIEAGQHGDAPDQQQRAAEQAAGRMKLDGPAEALLIDHEDQQERKREA